RSADARTLDAQWQAPRPDRGARTRGVAAGRSVERACERSSDWRRGAAGSPDPNLVPCGGSPREGAWSELASGAATGGGGPQAPPTRTRHSAQAPPTRTRYGAHTPTCQPPLHFPPHSHTILATTAACFGLA